MPWRKIRNNRIDVEAGGSYEFLFNMFQPTELKGNTLWKGKPMVSLVWLQVHLAIPFPFWNTIHDEMLFETKPSKTTLVQIVQLCN